LLSTYTVRQRGVHDISVIAEPYLRATDPYCTLYAYGTVLATVTLQRVQPVSQAEPVHSVHEVTHAQRETHPVYTSGPNSQRDGAGSIPRASWPAARRAAAHASLTPALSAVSNSTRRVSY
jgi:hypothetical protein